MIPFEKPENDAERIQFALIECGISGIDILEFAGSGYAKNDIFALN